MITPRHILFPTDFSDNADNALPFAVELSRRTGAKLTLFHVIETPFNMPHDSDDLPATHAGKARELIEQKVGEISGAEGNEALDVDAILQNGNVVTSILDQSRASGIDLVVMGTKGTSKKSRILYGSIASHVILDSEIPVLAIPANCHTVTFNPITFATDYRQGDLPALQHTLEWAETFHSDLNILHIADHRDLKTDIMFRGFRDMVTEQAPERTIRFDLLVKKQFLTGVADYLTDHPIGLLVLVRYKKNRIESLLSKDHTRELSYYTKVPLLILTGEEAPVTTA